MTIDEIISKALSEDIGDGDHTSMATVPDTAVKAARMVAKEDGILCGVHVAEQVFLSVDSNLKVDILRTDGTAISKGDMIMQVSGKARSILIGERTALNFLQRMSGIATTTNRLVKQIEGTRTKLLDTRKTTPLLRELEKHAVRCGGGTNHRFGLFDMVLIKDNHIDFAGGIHNAIRSVDDYLNKIGKKLPVEIEVRNFEELNQVLEMGKVDRIMLDNFTPAQIREALQLIDGRYAVEASGGITEATIRDFAETGVDYISVGALTHHIKSLDISLLAD